MKIKITRKTKNINAEYFFEKEIKPFSKTSAHIICPKKYIGKNATIVIHKKKNNKTKKNKKVSFKNTNRSAKIVKVSFRKKTKKEVINAPFSARNYTEALKKAVTGKY